MDNYCFHDRSCFVNVGQPSLAFVVLLRIEVCLMVRMLRKCGYEQSISYHALEALEGHKC